MSTSQDPSAKRPKRVAVVGDIMLDVHVHCEVTGLSPEDDIAPKLRIREETYRPGGAGNAALNLKSLGLIDEVHLFGVIGTDYNCNTLKEVIEGAAIKLFDVRCDDRPTTVKTRYLTQRGRHLCRVDHESAHPVVGHVRNALEMAIKSHGPYDLILVSDYGKGMVTEGLMCFLRSRDVRIVVDPKGDDFTKYGSVYAVTPNQREFMGVMKERQADVWTLKCEAKNVILTRGKRGCQLFRVDTRQCFAHAYTSDYAQDLLYVRPREVGDPTGCGDSFVAGLASSLVVHTQYDGDERLAEACRFANAVGACAYDHQGAWSVTLEEVQNELETFTY